MKTIKITTDNVVSIIDVNFNDFRSIQNAIGGILRDSENTENVGLFQMSDDVPGG